MSKDINKKTFDESTLFKLDIFRECFREWLPVFIHDPFTKKAYIFDFFAGSGTDNRGVSESPVVLLDEARGDAKKYCSKVKKQVIFVFSESNKKKCETLTQSIDSHIKQCENSYQCGECVYNREVFCEEFHNVLKNGTIQSILKDRNFGKFLLLDQYGYKEIDDDIFQQLIQFPRTDFIFFISSSNIKRFKDQPNVTRYIATNRINFDESKPTECHRIIADYYRSLIPSGKEYYLHHFTIKKGANYWGLIFCTGHTYGMEKFLDVCWRHDQNSGEANFNIENDYEPGSLFYDSETSNKKQQLKKELSCLILKGKITTNLEGFKFLLKKGGKTELFVETIELLLIDGKVKIEGKFNKAKRSMHKIDSYRIKVVNNGNKN